MSSICNHQLGYLTIWEVDFNFTLPPKVVESLPTPDETAGPEVFRSYLFHPTLSRLAIAFQDTLLVWDAQGSKLLLKISDQLPSQMSFSSDGLFFACLLRRDGQLGYVWKESPSGYILHQRLVFTTSPWHLGGLSLSPDRASGIAHLGQEIHLWHTKDPIHSSHPIPAPEEFVLGFSPCKTLAAFARESENTTTVLNLQSGNPQLVIDTGIEVRCLGVTRSTIVVAGEEKVVTWNVVAEDTRAGINDSVRITTYDFPPASFFDQPFLEMSASPDLSCIVAMGKSADGLSTGMEIYNTSTGRCTASAAFDKGMLKSPSLPMNSRSLIRLKIHTCG